MRLLRRVSASSRVGHLYEEGLNMAAKSGITNDVTGKLTSLLVNGDLSSRIVVDAAKIAISHKQKKMFELLTSKPNIEDSIGETVLKNLVSDIISNSKKIQLRKKVLEQRSEGGDRAYLKGWQDDMVNPPIDEESLQQIGDLKLLMQCPGIPDINHVGTDGKTAFTLILDSGDIDSITYALEELGADVNCKNSEGNALMHMLSVFIPKGGLGIEKDDELQSKLLFPDRPFSYRPDGCVMRPITINKFDIHGENRDGKTAMQLALEAGSRWSGTRLVRAGADVNTVDSEGRTIAMLELMPGGDQFDVKLLGANISLYMKSGLDLGHKDNSGKSIFSYVVDARNSFCGYGQIEEYITALVGKGERIKQSSDLGRAIHAISLAIRSGRDVPERGECPDDFFGNAIGRVDNDMCKLESLLKLIDGAKTEPMQQRTSPEAEPLGDGAIGGASFTSFVREESNSAVCDYRTMS